MFPVQQEINTDKVNQTSIGNEVYTNLEDVSNLFKTQFYNSGIMINCKIYSEETTPQAIEPKTLKQIRIEAPIDEKYFLNGLTAKWEYLKGAKKIERVKPNGEPYIYSEGSMSFPDNIDLPARTMLTSESSINRSTHVITDFKTNNLRLLTPVECERLNGFPDNWTDTGMPEKFRYFVMGNALVVPIVTTIGNRILEIQ